MHLNIAGLIYKLDITTVYLVNIRKFNEKINVSEIFVKMGQENNIVLNK